MMRDTILDWQSNLFDEYLAYRKRSASCAPSTRRTIQAAVFGFFIYMNENGIANLSDITAQQLYDWHITSKHESVRGRNLYTSQLRLFFEYLEERKMVPPTLVYALTHQNAPVNTNVKVLSKEQLEVIERYREQASTPMQLRDAAMIMLGLRMGMRGCDIRKLRISDISWKEQTISFTQQKTGVFITLPMPTEVGNSLFLYLSQGRPKRKQPCEQVFLSHMPPYDGLRGTCAVRRSIDHAFRDSGVENPGEFHITRRSFASSLLRAGSSVSLIVSTLGHTTVHTAGAYLSTDTETLRRCAIGCAYIPYEGSYGL